VTPSESAGIPRDISGALAARSARLGALASRLVYFETTSSTNDVADRLAAEGAPHGTVVTADAQESGRGRMGRTWFSPPGAGLYVSVVLRPEVPSAPRGVAFASAVSLAAGVALAEGIRATCGLEVAIKWPNDLVVARRKVCGILAEASSRAGLVQYVILGYGINVRPAAYPPDIAHRATSLETELGREVDRASLLAETLAGLAKWLEAASGSFSEMLNRWRELSPSSVGAAVEVMRPGGAWAAATTAGVDEDGALLATIGGRAERVIAGEIRWL
jgi:BirA family transcriptional regulator, biotin operon repressor / biotin---[acetyl-CoA-carboxylase] ligase